MVQLRLDNVRYYAPVQVLNAYVFCFNENSINLIRMFSGHLLEGMKMAPQKTHNGRYYAHALVLNAYNFRLS